MAPNHRETPVIPDLPVCGIKAFHSAFLHAAVEYTRLHTSEAVVNHCLRSACFTLLAKRKLPPFADIDIDLVVYACIMHDMGWSKTSSLISQDKRFEVDGANIARNWIREQVHDKKWEERHFQLIWDAIALHTTPSIYMYKELEVAAVGLGIATDIRGPFVPDALVTEEEFKEIIAAIPRLGLADEFLDIFCGLCRDKPATTFDNFASDFGVNFGLDGKGSGKEAFAAEIKQRSIAKLLLSALKEGDQLGTI